MLNQDEVVRDGPGDLSALCRIGGIAAFLLSIYSLATMVQMVVLGGQPASAAQAFDLLQHHRAVGLLRLDLPTIAVLPLYYLLFLGLYAALRRTNRAQALLSTVLVFAGLTLVLATPTALSMIPLSDKYAAATSDAARTQLLATGEAIMAADIWHSTAAILGGVLLQCGAVLICVVMLRGGVFGKATAWLGIVMHALDGAHIVGGLFLPVSGIILMAIAGPLYPIWLFLVGRRLLQLAARQD
ncbi:MAG: hypothetical protein ABSC88_06820 [Terracidiphilus sp.]|jgi:hypothetical protein